MFDFADDLYEASPPTTTTIKNPERFYS